MILAVAHWDTIGTFAFAAVTAAATVLLAIAAFRQIAAGRDTADATRDSVGHLAASVEAIRDQARQSRLPRLTPAEPSEVPVSTTNMGTRTRLRLRNDGYGPAVIVLPTAMDGAIQMPEETLWQPGKVSAQIVPAGGEVELTGNDPGQPFSGRFYLRVVYTDVLGEQETTTYIHVEQQGNVWNVTGTLHQAAGSPVQKWGDSWNTDWLSRQGLSA